MGPSDFCLRAFAPAWPTRIPVFPDPRAAGSFSSLRTERPRRLLREASQGHVAWQPRLLGGSYIISWCYCPRPFSHLLIRFYYLLSVLRPALHPTGPQARRGHAVCSPRGVEQRPAHRRRPLNAHWGTECLNEGTFPPPSPSYVKLSENIASPCSSI